MCASFTLELYFEHDDDRAFAESEAAKLAKLVGSLAPHVVLDIHTLKATRICRSRFPHGGTQHDVPNQDPSCVAHQSLLITRENIGACGWAGPKKGCLSRDALEDKAKKGADSADISIHEWLHTVSGLTINSRTIPDPDTNAHFGFPIPSGKSPDGTDTWHDWYTYALRSH